MVRSNCCHLSRYSDMTAAITIGLLVTSSHNWSPTLGQWTSRQSRILTGHKDRPLRSVTGDLQSSAKMRIISKGHRICIVCALVFVSAHLYSCLRISQGLLTVEAPVAGSLLSSLVKWDRWRGKAKPKAFVCINTEYKDVEIQKLYDTKYKTMLTAISATNDWGEEIQKRWSAQIQNRKHLGDSTF